MQTTFQILEFKPDSVVIQNTATLETFEIDYAFADSLKDSNSFI